MDNAAAKKPVPPADGDVLVRHALLDVPCGLFGRRVHADWYFPAEPGRAAGVVWLQHGFSRTKRNVASLAESLTARTGAIVVAPTISSNALAPGGAAGSTGSQCTKPSRGCSRIGPRWRTAPAPRG